MVKSLGCNDALIFTTAITIDAATRSYVGRLFLFVLIVQDVEV